MDIFIIMIVMLVNCMQTVYLSFIFLQQMSSRFSEKIFHLSWTFIVDAFSKWLKTKLTKRPDNKHFFKILSDHTSKRAERRF